MTMNQLRGSENKLLNLYKSVSLMQESNKYQFYSPWFDPIWARTHNLPHSMEEYANHYTTDAVKINVKINQINYTYTKKNVHKLCLKFAISLFFK